MEQRADMRATVFLLETPSMLMFTDFAIKSKNFTGAILYYLEFRGRS